MLSLKNFHHMISTLHHLKNLQVKFRRNFSNTTPGKGSQILLDNQDCSGNIFWFHAISVCLHCLNSNLRFFWKENIDLQQMKQNEKITPNKWTIDIFHVLTYLTTMPITLLQPSICESWTYNRSIRHTINSSIVIKHKLYLSKIIKLEEYIYIT